MKANTHVKKGDEVKKGALLAKAGGFVSVPLHAPTSGTVTAIDKCPGPTSMAVPAIQITADGEDEWGSPFEPMTDWKNESPDDLRQRVWDAGVVGMGGAGFPTHVKLSPPEEKEIDTLILNGAECEPYLTADDRLMQEAPDGGSWRVSLRASDGADVQQLAARYGGGGHRSAGSIPLEPATADEKVKELVAELKG